MPVRTAYAGAAVSGEVLTAANLNKMPGGWIGYNEVTANQGGITNTETDLTGLSVAVTVGSARRILVRVEISVLSSVSGDVPSLRIKEGTTQLQSREVHLSAAGSTTSILSASVILTPTAGAHTYKAALVRAIGTGNVSLQASATIPAYIFVEDLGPAS